MTRTVIGPDVALALAAQRRRVPARHRLLAPTLLRSQVLAQLYAEVQAGRLPAAEARRQLDHLRLLKIRLLGDRVLQQRAWTVAQQLGWPDTFVAEYVALTQLQADALCLRDTLLAQALQGVVTVVPLETLFD